MTKKTILISLLVLLSAGVISCTSNQPKETEGQTESASQASTELQTEAPESEDKSIVLYSPEGVEQELYEFLYHDLEGSRAIYEYHLDSACAGLSIKCDVYEGGVKVQSVDLLDYDLQEGGTDGFIYLEADYDEEEILVKAGNKKLSKSRETEMETFYSDWEQQDMDEAMRNIVYNENLEELSVDGGALPLMVWTDQKKKSLESGIIQTEELIEKTQRCMILSVSVSP